MEGAKTIMDMDLIKLQKGCKATCVVLKNSDIDNINSKLLINSNCENSELFKIFKEKISNMDEQVEFLVIEGIDKIEIEKQEIFYQIVKDREFNGYLLPKGVIVVLTVENEEALKNILPELYNICVVAF